MENLLKNFASYLFDVGQDSAAQLRYLFDGEHPYHVSNDQAVPLPFPPKPLDDLPQRLDVTTLASFVEILKANIDDWSHDELLVVCAPAQVSLLTMLSFRVSHMGSYAKNRAELLRATFEHHRFDPTWDPLVLFRRAIVVNFEDDPERQRLREDTAAFSFRSAIVRETGEDGAGMETTDQRNAIAGTKKRIDNPIYELRAWSSFPEAGPQIAAPWLLQITGGEDEETTGLLTDISQGTWKPAAAAQVGEHVKGLCEAAGLGIAVVW